MTRLALATRSIGAEIAQTSIIGRLAISADSAHSGRTVVEQLSEIAALSIGAEISEFAETRFAGICADCAVFAPIGAHGLAGTVGVAAPSIGAQISEIAKTAADGICADSDVSAPIGGTGAAGGVADAAVVPARPAGVETAQFAEVRRRRITANSEGRHRTGLVRRPSHRAAEFAKSDATGAIASARVIAEARP